MSSTERSMIATVTEHVPTSRQAYDDPGETLSLSAFVSDYLAVADELMEIERDFARWYCE